MFTDFVALLSKIGLDIELVLWKIGALKNYSIKKNFEADL